ncbi:hypothetical protein K439DRAFT_1314220, partial [Ramaria rubella]
PDNVFVSTNLSENVLRCTTLPEEWPARTDHFPIHTKIKILITFQVDQPKFNFRDMDWEEFRKSLEATLDMSQLESPITDEPSFYSRLKTLTKAILDSIKSSVPKTKPSPFAKRWWTREIAKKCKLVKKLGR